MKKHSLPECLEKEILRTNNNKTNATYETTDAYTMNNYNRENT